MNYWVSYAVGLSQLIVLFWLALPFCLWMTYDNFVSTNRAWCQDRRPPRHAVRLSYLTGSAWVAVLIYQLAVSGFATPHLPPGAIAPAAYRLFVGSLLSFVAIYSFHWCVEYWRWARKIPLQTKRNVTIERRELTGIVNPRWVYGAYLLLGAAAALGAVALRSGHLAATAVATGMRLGGTVAIITLIISVAMAYSVRRKKQPLDGTFGPSYRKSELILWISLLYGLGILCILGLIDALCDTHLLSPVSIVIGLSALVQFCLFYLGRHPWLRWLFPRNPDPVP
jgi:hypothetical protein